MKTGVILFVAGLLAAATAQGQIVIPTVRVGNAGNANDTTGYGGVSYEYFIGQYEVTNGQYAAFLNSVAKTDTYGLYNTEMAGTYGGITRSGPSGSYTYTATDPNTPVNFVSFWDAARFTNWLTNGQVAGGTETGVYNLGGVTNPVNNTITRDMTAWNHGGVAIASENEWYKAAYYDPAKNGGLGEYWLYPTQSDNVPSNDLDNPDPGNGANFYQSGYTDPVNFLTEVGAFENSASAYGTFDQGGNAWEWNEEIWFLANRGLRGGSFGLFGGGYFLQSSVRSADNSTTENASIGFRVTSLAPITGAEIPEPAQVGGLALGVLGLWILRRRG